MGTSYRNGEATPAAPTLGSLGRVGPQHTVAGPYLDLSAPAREARPLIGDAVDLRLLVIAADGQEPEVEAVTATLDRIGTPYDTLIAAEAPLTPARLARGDHAHYQGVILTRGNLAYWNRERGRAESALDAAAWRTLQQFETRFGVRRVAWYVLPGSAPDGYGLELRDAVDTAGSPLTVRLTDRGRAVFPYLNPANPVALDRTWAYLARPTGAHVTPLLVSPAGETLGAIAEYADGRQQLALTMAHRADLLHTLLLGYGLVSWVTRGLFVGERRVYLSVQVDDVFGRNRLWDPVHRTDAGGPEYRLDAADARTALAGLTRLRRQPNAADLDLELAFNGEGVAARPADDTLVPFLARHQAAFRWANHAFTHSVAAGADATAHAANIRDNHEVARAIGLSRYQPAGLVPTDLTALDRPGFLQAAREAGVRYLTVDSSRPGGSNPAPNQGIVCPEEPDLLIVPRHPSNLFANVSTPAEWVSEYNQIYRTFWGRELAFAEVVAQEASIVLRYLLTFDVDPLIAHQCNLRAYDGERCLLLELIEAVVRQYNALYADVPIRSLGLQAIGEAMAERARWRAGLTGATLVRGGGIVLSANRDVLVPITGARVGAAAEDYAGQAVSRVAVMPYVERRIPLALLVGYEPTPARLECEPCEAGQW